MLKTGVAGVHKTERGGVALDLRDDDAVQTAAERIGAPFIVQPFVRGGVELLVGAVEDSVFGPLVAVGPGGTLAELIGEASFRLAPLTDSDANELVTNGKVGLLLGGFRGAPPADTAAAADVLLRIGHMVNDLPEIAELDLNPVIAGPSAAWSSMPVFASLRWRASPGRRPGSGCGKAASRFRRHPDAQEHAWNEALVEHRRCEMSTLKDFLFKVEVIGGTEPAVTAIAEGKPRLKVVTPPEFSGGVPSRWSPEEMLVGSVATCYALTLRAVAERRAVPLRRPHRRRCRARDEARRLSLRLRRDRARRRADDRRRVRRICPAGR